MRAVVQRVHAARVEVEGRVVGAVERGLVAFVGAEEGDTGSDSEHVAHKIRALRVFVDETGKMSRSVTDVGGGLLIVSQFTLLGDVRRGNRPSFTRSLEPAEARRRIEEVVQSCRSVGLRVETGEFGADMRVLVENDGPVTILIDSRRAF
jgi:D-aminoacyl-tRNA deacylase